MISILAGIGIGVTALLTGLTGGYFWFNKKDNNTHNIKDTEGVINNVVQIEDNQIKGQNYSIILYILLAIILLLLFNIIYNVYHCHRRKLKKKYNQPSVSNVTV